MCFPSCLHFGFRIKSAGYGIMFHFQPKSEMDGMVGVGFVGINKRTCCRLLVQSRIKTWFISTKIEGFGS